jgi:hypothetical protein
MVKQKPPRKKRKLIVGIVVAVTIVSIVNPALGVKLFTQWETFLFPGP